MAKVFKDAVEIPPYLKQVRIRDYPPLRDAKVDFKPGLNIIIGKNGAGKTRFLSLTNSLVDPYNGYHTDGLGCEFIIAGRHEIKARLVEETDSSDDVEDSSSYTNGAQWPLLVATTYGSQTIEGPNLFAAIDELTNDHSFLYYPVLIRHGIPSSRLPIVDENTELLAKIFRRKIAVVISLDTASKNLDTVESRFIKDITSVIIRAIRHSLHEQDASLAVTAVEARKVIAKNIDEYLVKLSDYLSLYSPIKSTRISEVFQVYRNTVQDELIIKGLVLEYLIGATWLPFSALSDGTKRIFYILTEILSPLGMGMRRQDKIILLEEPELGIHPSQLHKLLSLIREVSREHQVIMTTHSPQVLDMLSEKELDRITICALDPKKGTQFHKLSAAKKQQARAYMREELHLSDFWRYSYLENEA